MAASLRTVFLGSSQCFNLIKQFKLNTPVRSLFSAARLGLDAFELQQSRAAQQFNNMQDKFKERLKEFIESDAQNTVFSEDIKNFVHIAKKEDVDVIKKMIKKYNEQNKNLRFSSFVFGPVVQRMCYKLGLPDLGLELIKDEQNGDFFAQFSSFYILMDLLYKNGRYQDVIDVQEILKERRIRDRKFHTDCLILAQAACYKMNTPESYKYGLQLMKDVRDSGFVPVRRATCFIAALALNQNEANTAMELLQQSERTTYINIRNLRIITLAALDRLEYVFLALEEILEDVPDTMRRRKELVPETLQAVSKALDRSGKKELQHRFSKLEEALRKGDHINETSLDGLLCSTIEVYQRPEEDNTLNRRSRSSTMGFNENTDQAMAYGSRNVRIPVRRRTEMYGDDE